ncbi:hypothetical protein FRC00_003123 [Tulasnella sp. 408]|nr:hypothetical protein FRC00_003123 [Tulasnella sp. 408]
MFPEDLVTIMADYTTILPPEMWLAVIELLSASFPTFDPKTTVPRNEDVVLRSSPYIWAVSAVSQFFHRLADPFRFENVHIMVDDDQGPTLKLRQIAELLNLLDRRPEVKMWIRILSVGQNSVSRRRRSVNQEYLPIEARIYKLIPELQNLNHLQCGLVSFSSALFAGVLQLPQLERLELQDFQLKQDLTDPASNWNSINRHGESLQSLVVKESISSSPETTSAIVYLLQQESLVELEYWATLFPDVGGGVSPFWIILQEIPEYVFTSLRQLEVMLPPSDIEFEQFVQFGTQCPNITSLTVIWNFTDSSDRLIARFKRCGLAEHHFPALQYFNGPFALAPSFTRGRPVDTVITDPWTRDIWNYAGENERTVAFDVAALKPSVPLRVLHFVVKRWNDADIGAVAQHYPELEELTYDYNGDDNRRLSPGVEEAFGKLAKLKSLALVNAEDGYPENKISDDHPLVHGGISSDDVLQQKVYYFL